MTAAPVAVAPSPADVRDAHGEATIDHLASKDFAGARAWFDAKMRDALSADKLREVWSAMESQLGPYKGHAVSDHPTVEGHPIVAYRLAFERGAAIASVVFDDQGEVIGLFFKPAQ